ncbi:MAG: hypothetical protein KCHDKBKB_02106 [Elusimicrobia bacterium]|nr:hypothetical protein [Elusimicrobiota bacterium]
MVTLQPHVFLRRKLQANVIPALFRKRSVCGQMDKPGSSLSREGIETVTSSSGTTGSRLMHSLSISSFKNWAGMTALANGLFRCDEAAL